MPPSPEVRDSQTLIIAMESVSERPADIVRGGRHHDPEEVDKHGDALFRFALPPGTSETPVSLTEFHRALLQDLLGIVVLYYKGRPVLVDSFAFQSEPDKITQILSTRTPE